MRPELLVSNALYFAKPAAVPLKIDLTDRYRFCYALDAFIAPHILSQRRCQRTELNPLMSDGYEANKHQPSSYPMVI